MKTKLDAEQMEIVKLIHRPQKLCGDRADAVCSEMNARAGCQLYDYVHVEKLCEIIEVLSAQLGKVTTKEKP